MSLRERKGKREMDGVRKVEGEGQVGGGDLTQKARRRPERTSSLV